MEADCCLPRFRRERGKGPLALRLLLSLNIDIAAPTFRRDRAPSCAGSEGNSSTNSNYHGHAEVNTSHAAPDAQPSARVSVADAALSPGAYSPQAASRGNVRAFHSNPSHQFGSQAPALPRDILTFCEGVE